MRVDEGKEGKYGKWIGKSINGEEDICKFEQLMYEYHNLQKMQTKEVFVLHVDRIMSCN